MELFPCFLMQSSVTMLYPSKHGNGARKTFLNRLPKNTALPGEGLQFYSRSSFKPSSLSTMSQAWISWISGLGNKAHERDIARAIPQPSVLFLGGKVPGMAGSKLWLWQGGQSTRGTAGRGFLELPLNIPMF